MTNAELIAEARRHVDEVHGFSTRTSQILEELADALEAAEAALAARQPTEAIFEDDREKLARIFHPGYNSGGYDRTNCKPCEKAEKDADEIIAAGFSRATVPDAAKQPDGWSSDDRQESKQEAERRWSRPVARETEQRYQTGCINGFMLGAEWQKARETFISYKVIADEARSERDAALAAVANVRAFAEGLMSVDAEPYPTNIGKAILAALDGASDA